MEDEIIIQLYVERKEEALKRTNQKYGAYCYKIAFGILKEEAAAGRCVNDAFVAAWLSIPQKRPACLREYLGELTRKIALDYADKHKKRKKIQKPTRKMQAQEKREKQICGRKQRGLKKLKAGLKYIPVAACISIVLFVSLYIVKYSNLNRSRTDFFLSASAGNGKERETGEGAVDLEMGQTAAEDGAFDDKYNVDNKAPALPMRLDDYEGPALVMTATGDVQHVKTTRRLQCKVESQESNGMTQPLLHIWDRYQIKNDSNEDKTLQLVYPFVTALNQSYGLDGDILKAQGGEEKKIEYGVGDGASAFLGGKPDGSVTLLDYERLCDPGSEYQENALQKAVDWNKAVDVYFFSDIQVKEGGGGVVGVTVAKEGADVLTFGFDYANAENYCFFAPTEYARPMLIITGAGKVEPKVGYYTNLDCEEEAPGIQCAVQKRSMRYADALRLCCLEATRKMEFAYNNGEYVGKLPEYFGEDAVFQALTAVSQEDEFYDALVKRYGFTQLEEIFEMMFEETRIVYAMVTVTIPAKKTVKVTARTQKRQANGNFKLPWDDEGQKTDFQYDFASTADSRLHVKKTFLQLDAGKMWKVTAEDMGLQKRGGLLTASFGKGAHSFILSAKQDLQ